MPAGTRHASVERMPLRQAAWTFPCRAERARRFPQLRHIDRAWASIVYAFQGRTIDTVIAAMEAKHPILTNLKTLYVEISRARDRAELATDDKAALRKTFEVIQPERSSGPDMEKARTPKGVDRDLGL